jgi:protein O-GlcNAc transferase
VRHGGAGGAGTFHFGGGGDTIRGMATLTLQQALAMGLEHQRGGRWGRAEVVYHAILALYPQNDEAHHQLGVVVAQGGRLREAEDHIRRAMELAPQKGVYPFQLGRLLQDGGRCAEAEQALCRALELQPTMAEAHSALGVLCESQGRYAEAIGHYQAGLAVAPGEPTLHYNMGVSLARLGRYEEAVASYRRAIELRPDFAEAQCNLGDALKLLGRFDEAEEACRRAMGLKPGLVEAHGNLATVLGNLGRHEEAVGAYRRALALRPEDARVHSNLVYALMFHPGFDARGIRRELDAWNERHAEPLKGFMKPHGNGRDPERRLRVGLISPDFRDHVVGRNVFPIFQHFDRNAFEIFCYSRRAAGDSLTERFRGLSTVWRESEALSDERLAAQIYGDGIDILMDLTLHLAGSSLEVFARKPAPVQVTFAGYPGSTGLTAMDYRLTDPYLDPVGMDESVYSERTVRLPRTFWCYDPLGEAIVPNELPAASAGGRITFGNLNYLRKTNEVTLELWARVLGEVAGSRLLLLGTEGSHCRRVREFFEGRGIDGKRLEFFSNCSRGAYLELYHQIDIGLDSVPYNGHTTSLDAFWMGVPVVTLVGNTVVGRAGFSQCMNLGLPELVAWTAEEYVGIATRLARDVPRLQGLRATLRARMEQSPLMDGSLFARAVGSAFRDMWRAWCAGQGAAG